ncbi:MAG TPA: hypothetical protein VGC84_05415 [Ilumatobacteraceae bacterium]|jgi:hypothetical protein
MAIQRKSTEPAGIVNASGQPEIVLEIDGLTLSMTPPAKPAAPSADGDEAAAPVT